MDAKTLKTMRLRSDLEKRISAITKHTIGSVYMKRNGKKITCCYFDYDTNEHMKCTVERECLIGNFRKDKTYKP